TSLARILRERVRSRRKCTSSLVPMTRARPSTSGPTKASHHSRPTCTSRARNSAPLSKKRINAVSKSLATCAQSVSRKPPRLASTILSTDSWLIQNSTPAKHQTSAPNQPPLEPRVIDAMLPQAAIDYLATRSIISENANSSWPVLLKKEMQFERDFVKAGGVLLAGEDPTGYGGDLAGFGDQRELELLVDAGFTPAEAIHIYTENGARFLGEEDHIGTLAAGKQADLIVVAGDPSTKIADIEKTELVFKDGVGYDSAKLIESVRGSVGLH